LFNAFCTIATCAKCNGSKLPPNIAIRTYLKPL
jgi:hypothetical protein